MGMIQELSTNLQSFLLGIGFMGAVFSCLLIFVESILPCFPLAILIAVVFYTFGKFFGLVICWVFTCLGCLVSYKICRGRLRKVVVNKFIVRLSEKNQKKINSVMDYITSMSTSSLTVLMALPFTPAFVVNIAAGLAGVRKKKFYPALIIGKLFMVYFWGYVGASLLESIANPIILIKVVAMLIAAVVISKIATKVFKIEGEDNT